MLALSRFLSQTAPVWQIRCAPEVDQPAISALKSLVERGNELDPASAASALRWWSDAGVDVLIDEQPRNWLRPAPKPLPEAVPTPAPDALPDQLHLFRDWLKSSDTLPFAAPAAPRVCPEGDPAAGLMIVAAMPEAEDCRAGALLSGAAGRLFDRMLAAIGRDRASIYLAALSCLRSPDGQLRGDAATRCAELARHHIGLAAPRALLLLGDSAAKAMIGLATAQARGRWHEVATHAGPIKALVTMSPEHLLRRPEHKAFAWADLQMLAEGLG
jgi:DNA polymerase